MKKLLSILTILLLAGCATFDTERQGAQTGLSDFVSGDTVTPAKMNAIKNTADTADALASVNEGHFTTLHALVGPVFSDGDGTYTDMSAISAAELGLLDGETDLATQAELNTAAALVDTDDEIIAIINASPSTQISHGAGGLAADVSAYTGIPAITGGATYELNTTAELSTATGVAPVSLWKTATAYAATTDATNRMVYNDGVLYK